MHKTTREATTPPDPATAPVGDRELRSDTSFSTPRLAALVSRLARLRDEIRERGEADGNGEQMKGWAEEIDQIAHIVAGERVEFDKEDYEGYGEPIRSALRAAAQRFERSNENPIEVWGAVWMCTQPGNNLTALPQWCADYLYEVANHLLHLFDGFDVRPRRAPAGSKSLGNTNLLTFEQVESLVCQAFGLTRSGWSAFKRAASDAEKIALSLEYERLKTEGLSHDNALAKASKVLGAGRCKTPDATKKAVQAGKKLLAHVRSGVPRGARRNTPWGRR
jgi:hypothetical protein